MSSDRLAWPILLLLLTVLVPSVGVVWMMREAVRNERLATSQLLRDSYQTQLESARQSLQQDWDESLRDSANRLNGNSPPQAFSAIISEGPFDSVLVYDRQGKLLYPTAQTPPTSVDSTDRQLLAQAELLEYTSNDPVAAADSYESIVTETASPAVRGHAQLARVRCLLKSDQRDEAIALLQALGRDTQLTDVQGRSVAATAHLRLLELLDAKPEDRNDDWKKIAKQLAERLRDYASPLLPPAQRRFLMDELERISAASDLATELNLAKLLIAEELAAKATSLPAAKLRPDIAPDASPNNATRAGNLTLSPLQHVWMQHSADGRLTGLLRTETVRTQLLARTAPLPVPNGVEFAVTAPGETTESLLAVSLGEQLADWRLHLVATGGDPFSATSQQRRTVHLWIAALTVAATCVLAWLLANALRKRLRLAQLKNDLVATVSHELKTPLAAIRLLVDTLLAAQDKPDDEQSPQQLREYLELISQENSRLTRLIDNFLTFSRLERGGQRFDFQRIDLHEVARRSATIFREHLGESNHTATNGETHDPFSLHLDLGDQPLVVSGDLDSLVTAVVNLLENAWKYSEDEKRITLAVRSQDDHAVLTVEDNGIGLSPRAASRVFDRFYQVDQRVARSQSGCGLGLSIVRALVEAHGGQIEVESQPEVGSTFTIRLPLAADTSATSAEATT